MRGVCGSLGVVSSTSFVTCACIGWINTRGNFGGTAPRENTRRPKDAAEVIQGALALGKRQKPWLGKDLVGTEMTYGHLAAGRAHWSDHKFFFRSAEFPSKRHYIIAGTLPTGVVGIGEVPREEGQGLLQLPCFGSRSLLAGWYSKMDDALNALESAVGDQRAKAAEHVRKLYESFLSFPLRLRLSPSPSQICSDRISYGEELYAGKWLLQIVFSILPKV